MELLKVASENESALASNSYPGRGIIQGLTPDAQHFVQIYWIMGRSTNSCNRICIAEKNQWVRTQAFNASLLQDPSLIIYFPMKHEKTSHIVSNGVQTNTIFDYVTSGKSFEQAVHMHSPEPDGPHYTPRISGLVELSNTAHTSVLSIIKTVAHHQNYYTTQFYYYSKPIPGIGHCIHTYAGDSEVLPSFQGDPFVVQLFDSVEKTSEYYWSLLNVEKRVSLIVKFIPRDSSAVELKIINTLQ